MQPPVGIRAAVPADAGVIQKLVWKELYLPDVADFHWHTAPTVLMAISKGLYFVAESEGRIVGILEVEPRRTDLWIEVVAVVPDCRKRGIGRQLVEHTRRLAREQGRTRVLVSTFRQYRAEGIYQALGFEILFQDSACTWLGCSADPDVPFDRDTPWWDES